MGQAKPLPEEEVQQLPTISSLNFGPSLPDFVWNASKEKILELARQFAGDENPFIGPHEAYTAAQRLIDFAKEVQEACREEAFLYVENGHQAQNMRLNVIERSTWVYEGPAQNELDELEKQKKSIQEKAKKEGNAFQRTSTYLRTKY